jgi:methionyl aminopeptidase
MIFLKSKNEIESMRKSGKVIVEIFKELSTSIKPGISTLDIDKIVEQVILSNNAIASFKGYDAGRHTILYPASACVSINDEIIHGIPSAIRILHEGDIVSVDVGVYLDGFHTDAARTYPVGIIGDTARRLIEVARKSFFEGAKKAKAGNRISDISRSIQEYVEGNGFEVVKDYVGHGVGRSLHEAPDVPNFLESRKGIRIEKGMTLAIEPMVTEGSSEVELSSDGWTVTTQDGSLSTHYENTIAVTDGDAEILTLS